VNRQTKRQMAKSGTDRPARGPERRAPVQSRERERTSPTEFFSEVRGEMRKVAWPTRPEVINSTMVVLIAVIFMGALIFALDYSAAKFVLFLFG
jgi:preprotein translocase subunit SecE